MRAIVIDPFECEVKEIDFDYKDYRDLYPLLSHPIHPVDCFDIVRLDDGDAVFVDDNGLLNNPQRFFKLRCYHQPLAGKGLILGSNEEGETVSAKTDIDWIVDQVEFMHRTEFGSLSYTRKKWRPDNV